MSAGCAPKRIALAGVTCAFVVSCTKDAPPAPPSRDAGVSSVAATSLATDRDARGTIKTACLSCHTEEMLSQQRLTETQWSKVVAKMTTWGANIEAAETAPLVAYLAATYGPDAGAYPLPSVDAAEAAREVAAMAEGDFASGDAERGRPIYVDKCSGCHGPEARGHIGVNLVDRPFLFRAPEFAATIRRGRGKMTPIAMPDRDVADLLAHLGRLR